MSSQSQHPEKPIEFGGVVTASPSTANLSWETFGISKRLRRIDDTLGAIGGLLLVMDIIFIVALVRWW